MKKDEFNPTKKDLLNLDNLLLELRNKKLNLIQRKIVLQNALSNLKNNYSLVDFKSREFNDIKAKRNELKNSFNLIELEIKQLNEEINYKNKLRLEVEYHIKNNKTLNIENEILLKKILQLKLKYTQFTKDRTRIASLRIMASEFIEELEYLVK